MDTVMRPDAKIWMDESLRRLRALRVQIERERDRASDDNARASCDERLDRTDREIRNVEEALLTLRQRDTPPTGPITPMVHTDVATGAHAVSDSSDHVNAPTGRFAPNTVYIVGNTIFDPATGAHLPFVPATPVRTWRLIGIGLAAAFVIGFLSAVGIILIRSANRPAPAPSPASVSDEAELSEAPSDRPPRGSSRPSS